MLQLVEGGVEQPADSAGAVRECKVAACAITLSDLEPQGDDHCEEFQEVNRESPPEPLWEFESPRLVGGGVSPDAPLAGVRDADYRVFPEYDPVNTDSFCRNFEDGDPEA